MAISRKTTSGREGRATSSARAAVDHGRLPGRSTATSWPASRPRPARRRRPGSCAAASRADAAAGGARRPSTAALGGRPDRQRHDELAPLPGPSLWASTVPPCNSTRRLTSVSPMPKPPCERDRASGRPGETSRKFARACAAGMPGPLSRMRTMTRPPSRFDGDPDRRRRWVNTWPRC